MICGLLSQELPPCLSDMVQAGEKKTFFLEENILLFLTWGLWTEDSSAHLGQIASPGAPLSPSLAETYFSSIVLSREAPAQIPAVACFQASTRWCISLSLGLLSPLPIAAQMFLGPVIDRPVNHPLVPPLQAQSLPPPPPWLLHRLAGACFTAVIRPSGHLHRSGPWWGSSLPGLTLPSGQPGTGPYGSVLPRCSSFLLPSAWTVPIAPEMELSALHCPPHLSKSANPFFSNPSSAI